MRIYTLAIEPFEKSGLTHNSARVDIDYESRMGGPVLRVQTLEEGSDGFEKFAIFGSPASRIQVETGWSRNNKKRLDALATAIRSQLIAGQGEIVDKIQKFLADNLSGIVAKSAVTSGR
jgi:hypothetical protein